MRRDILEIDTSHGDDDSLADVSLLDVESIRLLLSGGSVIDWQRLAFTDIDQVDRFLCLHHCDQTTVFGRERLRYVYNESVSYLEEHLRLRFPEELRDPDDVRQIFLWASQFGGFRRKQILSCVILKLVHVIHHMEAADLKFKTTTSEEQLLASAHAHILSMARIMQDAGLPVVSFYGSRKARSSVITKLLAKKETVAATIFDKLRFRIVVREPQDLVVVLGWMTRHMLPFNYCIPGQCHNNLLNPEQLNDLLGSDDLGRAQLSEETALEESGKNEFSGSSYRMINFIMDYPVKVAPAEGPAGFELGNVVFVMVEFQLLDEQTAIANEQGDNAHHCYKERQHDVVARRLKRGRRTS
jgi:uncharacterized protein (TIGR04552 family)